jgi:hypothetical protein
MIIVVFSLCPKMDFLVRIDPFSFSTPMITEENFKYSRTLNKTGECDNLFCNFGCCRELREPQNGFWLSKPTENGSCVWKDYTHEMFGSKYGDYERNWSNIRMVRYKCRPTMKLFMVKTVDDIRPYIYTLPPKSYDISKMEIQKKNRQVILDFLKENKIDYDETIPIDKTSKGINVSWNVDEIIIKRTKKGSKKEIMASANYWLGYISYRTDLIKKNMDENISIDYDKLREEGYHGVYFNLEEPKEDSDDISSNINSLLESWITDTCVVWDYCFTSYKVSYEAIIGSIISETD